MRCEHLFKACTYDNTVYEYSNLKNAGLGLGYEFGSQIVQGLSVGYSDIYGRLLDGQEIYLDSTVCNGYYVLVAQFDPKNIFLESNKENNISICLLYTSRCV